MADDAHRLVDTFDAARSGDQRAVARLISHIESHSSAVPELAALISRHQGHAHVVGLTGPPGVGKSTVTAELATTLRASGARVGVLAVDPSSPFSGGALLGDRVRMQELATDPGIYVRSMATRGHLGGLATAAPMAIQLLDAVGCDWVLVETVGVGQAEVEIAELADTTLVLLAPGMGDGIQAAKAGLLEIADIFVVNKAERPGADATVRDLKNMLALGGAHSVAGTWRPRIAMTVAVDGKGIPELLADVEAHWAWLASHDTLTQRRLARLRSQIIALAGARFLAELPAAEIDELVRRVAAGELDVYVAAEALVRGS